MVADGYVSKEDGEKAKNQPLGVNPRALSPNTYVAGYFAEDVRRELADRYGEKKLYEGGLSVRTTLDPKMQVMARRALVDGLVRYDEAHGFRGAMQHIETAGDWGVPLGAIPALGDVQPWRLAVVLDVSDAGARIGLQPPREKSGDLARERETGTLANAGMAWTRRTARSALTVGDVIYVEPIEKTPGFWRLRQVPDISGAIMAMDPFTGRIFAMVGGFSFDQSEFNRASQAWRQPGSAFKPFVYATALDNGYTPSSVLLDDPISIVQSDGTTWSPENFEGKATGAHPLRYGIEHSKNMMTVRLAKDVGMPLIVEYSKRFGVYDDLAPYLSMSLGAGETTLMRMVTAYSMLANGGKRIKSTLIDRIQDRTGHTIYRHDERVCQNCDAPKWANQDEPKLIDKREQVLDPLTAYQITSIMEGVIQRGTGRQHQVGRQASRGQDRDDERGQGSLVRGFLARPRGRRVHRLRPPAFARRFRAGGDLCRADLPRFHDAGAEGQAGRAVPRAAGHQARVGRSADRDALLGTGHDSRSLQAGHGAAGVLRGWRRIGVVRLGRCGSRGRIGHGRTVLTP